MFIKSLLKLPVAEADRIETSYQLGVTLAKGYGCLWHEPPTCGSNPRHAAAPVRRVLTRAYAYFPTS